MNLLFVSYIGTLEKEALMGELTLIFVGTARGNSAVERCTHVIGVPLNLVAIFHDSFFTQSQF